jgi:hypothetical protein
MASNGGERGIACLAVLRFRGESPADRAIQLTKNSPVNLIRGLSRVLRRSEVPTWGPAGTRQRPMRDPGQMKVWKVVGLAGLVGVAATGVVVARSERKRRADKPNEVRGRAKLHLVEASEDAPSRHSQSGAGPTDPARSGATRPKHART